MTTKIFDRAFDALILTSYRIGGIAMQSRCDMCANYKYDEEEEYYTCGVNLDEDEMYRFLSGNCGDCPYFSQDDEYRVVRHQM